MPQIRSRGSRLLAGAGPTTRFLREPFCHDGAAGIPLKRKTRARASARATHATPAVHTHAWQTPVDLLVAGALNARTRTPHMRLAMAPAHA
eukprot:13066676-Alexandrium_andersonii.AAC.1